MTLIIENTRGYVVTAHQPGVPSLLVKQKYGSELRNQTVASLKPGIPQALGSLPDELRFISDIDTNGIKSRRQSNILCFGVFKVFNWS
ncbi:hypothetical protein ScPMuIL_006285 [Solemya velum]